MNYEKHWKNKINNFHDKEKCDLIFNWWENPEMTLIGLNKNFTNYILNKIKKNHKEFKKFTKKANIAYKVVFQLKNKRIIRINSLKKILNTLNINYRICSEYICEIGGSKCTFRCKFPIDLNRDSIPVLISAFMSDGHNQPDHPFYANLGFLGNKILKCSQDVIPAISYEVRGEKLRFHSIFGRILLKLGVPYGCKSKINPFVPKFIFEDEKWSKLYLQQAFDDEGHAPTKVSRKIVQGRSCALPKNLNWEYKERKTFNSLDDELKELVMRNPPNLLICEYFMLKELGIKFSIRCRSLKQYLDRTSADWVIEIYGKENIGKFHEKVGFSQPEKIQNTKNYIY